MYDLNSKFKKLLLETKELCLFGHECLNEEEAKDYLKFIVDSLKQLADKAKGLKNIPNDSLKNLNKLRLDKELKRNPKLKNDYFENDDHTLSAFENEFSKMFNQLKTKKSNNGEPKVSKEWIEKIQYTFNNYLSRFEKRSSDTSTDFAKKVNWKDKNVNKGKHIPNSKSL